MLKINNLDKIKEFGELQQDEEYTDSWRLKRNHEFGGILFKTEDNNVWSITDNDLFYDLTLARTSREGVNMNYTGVKENCKNCDKNPFCKEIPKANCRNWGSTVEVEIKNIDKKVKE